MSSKAEFPSGPPAVYMDIIALAEAEEITIVDAVANGDLNTSDLATFLSYARDTDTDLDPGLVRMVRLLKPLLAEHAE